MKRIIVNGGRALGGEMQVSGSKNAALPIIFACILTHGVSEITNLPKIGDVSVALDIIRDLGAEVSQRGNITYIDTRNLSYRDPSPQLVRRIRASTYLLGSSLARFGRCPLMAFGGCNFSLRPIDMHLDACRALGAYSDGGTLYCDRLRGGNISFDKASVGATVNAILLSSACDGEVRISGCAVEPHIDALIEFLCSCGASITRRGRELYIRGRELHGGRITVIGDMIEAGSYLFLGLMSGGNIAVRNAPIGDMDSVLCTLTDMGASLHTEGDILCGSLSRGNAISVITAPHPGFPTDLQPLLAPLLARHGGGAITDTVWPDRFGYLSSLSAFGISSSSEGGTAQIYPSQLHSGYTVAPDLRGGMAALISALCAEGQSIIDSAEVILRGYEGLLDKLSSLGADINISDT